MVVPSAPILGAEELWTGSEYVYKVVLWDSNGSRLWEHPLGLTVDMQVRMEALAVDVHGNSYFIEEGEMANYDRVVAIGKLDNAGALVWSTPTVGAYSGDGGWTYELVGEHLYTTQPDKPVRYALVDGTPLEYRRVDNTLSYIEFYIHIHLARNELVCVGRRSHDDYWHFDARKHDLSTGALIWERVSIVTQRMAGVNMGIEPLVVDNDGYIYTIVNRWRARASNGFYYGVDAREVYKLAPDGSTNSIFDVATTLGLMASAGQVVMDAEQRLIYYASDSDGTYFMFATDRDFVVLWRDTPSLLSPRRFTIRDVGTGIMGDTLYEAFMYSYTGAPYWVRQHQDYDVRWLSYAPYSVVDNHFLIKDSANPGIYWIDLDATVGGSGGEIHSVLLVTAADPGTHPFGRVLSPVKMVAIAGRVLKRHAAFSVRHDAPRVPRWW